MENVTKSYVADDELAALLQSAARTGKRLRVEAGGQIFVIDVSPDPDRDDIWRDYDPEAAREAWNASAGTLVGVDPKELIRELKEAREQHSLGRRW